MSAWEKLNEMQVKRQGDNFSLSMEKKEVFALMICLHEYKKANPGKQVYGIDPDELFQTLKGWLGGAR